MSRARRSWGEAKGKGACLLAMSALLCLGCGGCTEDRSAGTAAPGVTMAARVAEASPNALPSGKCAPGIVAPAGHMAIVEIPSLGGNEVFVQDVNEAGVVVGSERTADGRFHAFRYSDAGGLQDLGASGTAYASAVAADGTIGGHFTTAGDPSTLYGYRYTPSLGLVRVCDTACSIWDLDARGQVVGLAMDPVDAQKWQAFIQTPGSPMRRLGTLGGARSSASGLNDAGVVVGNAQVADSTKNDVGHAFLWDAQAGMRDLNSVAGAGAEGWVLKAANDVNARAIVGYGTYKGHTRPFLFDLATHAVTAVGGAGDGRDAFAWGVDAHGDVVGWSSSDGKKHEAFVYSANIGMRPLVEFVDGVEGWDLQQANAISDSGIVVGWGFHAGAPRGFKIALPLCHSGT
jgi:probable HAF family extracellular repeat protein